jgi:hypothetical protein
MKPSVFALALLFAPAFTANTNHQNVHLQTLPLIPHHSNEARRRMLSSADSIDNVRIPQSSGIRRRMDAVQVGALYQGYGTHYVDLWVGTPAQRQTLIVDTGSGVTAFPCSGCNPSTCGQGHHIDDFFDETKSTTFQKLACSECVRGHCSGSEQDCKIGMSYQEGSSWSAFEGRDAVYIGGPHDHGLNSDNGGTSDMDPNHAFAFSFPMTFGCQTKITGLFKTQLADGIMGMDDAPSAFWSQMYDHKLIDDKKFSLCFTRQPTAEKAGTEAGAMTMGGYDQRLHSSPMIYTGRYGGGGGFYNVHVRAVYLRHGSGGEGSMSTDPKAQVITLQVSEDNLNHGNVIVDSGTTDTYFSRRMATEFNNAYKLLTGQAYSHSGVTLTGAQLHELPTILIQLAGDDAMNKQLYPKNPSSVSGLAGSLDPAHPYDVLLAIPPSHYMEYDDKVNKYVARFYTDEGGGSVLGANAMMGHDVYFDLDDKRIGWAESDCDYHELISNGGFVDSLDGGSTSVKPETPTRTSTTSTTASSHDKDAAPKIHPAVDACNDLACRGTVAGFLFGFLALGLLVGRGCRRSTSKYTATDVTGDLELTPALNAEYRDDPELDDLDFSDNTTKKMSAAPVGTGYKDDVDVSNMRTV